MLLKKCILCCLVLFTLSTSAIENDKSGNLGLELLAAGKMTGSCGIFKLQLDFQDNTGLDNGLEFITRFWTYEAARLGLSLEEYSKTCHKVVEQYNFYQTTLEKDK